MGSSYSYVKSHGKRLINRYNAQFRALEHLNKERPAAPRHPMPNNYNLTEELKPKEDIHAKNLKLEEYLKDVYVKSYDPQETLPAKVSNPDRPLPELRETKLYAFNEPAEVIKGFCKVSEVSSFLIDHIENPEQNNTSAIAEKYSLDEKKVENILRYFTMFEIRDKPEPKEKEDDEEVTIAKMNEWLLEREKNIMLGQQEAKEELNKVKELSKESVKNL